MWIINFIFNFINIHFWLTYTIVGLISISIIVIDIKISDMPASSGAYVTFIFMCLIPILNIILFFSFLILFMFFILMEFIENTLKKNKLEKEIKKERAEKKLLKLEEALIISGHFKNKEEIYDFVESASVCKKLIGIVN